MKLLAAIGAFLFSGIVWATPLHNIVVFGDSLSDNGNLYKFMKYQLPPSPPYFEGRFSNGPVWIEHLIASYFPENPNEHLLDYAYGGAGVSEEEGDDEVLFTLRREVKNYLLEHNDKASEDSLFVIWIGSNNYLAFPEEVEKTLHDVHAGIVHSIQRLVEKGAKHILVVNLPDLGRTPAAIEFDSVDAMTYFAREHNDLLRKSIDDFRQEYPDVEWLYYDLHKAFEEVMTAPENYGFTNITGTCVNSVVEDITKKSVLKMVTSVKPGINGDGCTGYLFFDLVHPTALAHKILGDRAREMLDQAGIELTDR
ncbi:GDSL family lysophospholipase PlaA [Legionella anisa]|uniref:Lysophospholipase n=1 Tax=Legionella anisa TaxID=28082 RepID=A0AAX0WWP2_9GAMM|nr:SGNH/GDSL hydrolase family protein [Legionella anisa]AWN73289.1 lysophospholipase [Legionella anisa]KTC69898.1 lysophospholipase A [Legionella anisa]MBN5936676.1 SGNH/GDSL hydrolase family protein [Legionella anisa]MCW8423047.1 SGNH/GDSL hydrolase family protein [Legionella anisa]MCW8447810.1 SGNH/GDSL hydrolase family protein [Legionella anisa]